MNQPKKTLEDLLSAIRSLVLRDIFDDIMDADTADIYDVINTFKKVYPDQYQECVNEAIDMAVEEGATDERIAISGYEKA